MNWFTNLRISKKLLLAFAIVLTLEGVLGAVSLQKLAAVQDVAKDLGGNGLNGTRTVENIANALSAYRRWEMRALDYHGKS